MVSSVSSRPEHLQKLYSAYAKARPALVAEIANVFRERSGYASLRGRNLVDVGCGNGEISECFSEMGLSVTGVEYSSSRVLNMAARKRNFRLIAADGHYLPLQSRSFDFAVLADVLEHVYDSPRVIREVARVLKPGGLVFIGATNRCAIPNCLVDPHYHAPLIPLLSKKMAAWYVTKFLKLSDTLNIEKYFFRREIVQHLESAGFLCHDLPLYRDRLARGALATTSTNRITSRLLSIPSVRNLAVTLSSTWLFSTFVAPTLFFVAVRT